MNLFQKILYYTYPLRMKISEKIQPGSVLKNKGMKHPPVSFYSLKATLNTGEEIEFSRYFGEKVMIVNVASNCGYTPQYEQLQKLYTDKSDLVILAFPANNFSKQEPGSDQKIGSFCRKNYGVTFPVFMKDDVTGSAKQPVFEWLSDKTRNGWHDGEPKWNFYKYLVDEKGILRAVAPPKVMPENLLP